MWYVVRALSPATVEMLTETVAVSDFMVLRMCENVINRVKTGVSDVVKWWVGTNAR